MYTVVVQGTDIMHKTVNKTTTTKPNQNKQKTTTTANKQTNKQTKKKKKKNWWGGGGGGVFLFQGQIKHSSIFYLNLSFETCINNVNLDLRVTFSQKSNIRNLKNWWFENLYVSPDIYVSIIEQSVRSEHIHVHESIS